VNEESEMMQIATNLVCTLNLSATPAFIEDAVKSADATEENEYDLERFTEWFLQAFGPFGPEEGEEGEEVVEEAFDDDAVELDMKIGKTVDPPERNYLNDSWPVVSLRSRIQTRRTQKDIKGNKKLMHLYQMEHNTEDDDENWCCSCWYAWGKWWELVNQRYQDWNPVFNEEISYISENFGSGVALYFYQWRYLITTNMLIWWGWAVLMILPWFLNSLRQVGELRNWRVNATIGGETWFQREDASLTNALEGISGATTSGLIFDSFFFYSGYPGLYTYGTNTDSVAAGVPGFPYMSRDDWGSGLDPFFDAYWMDAAYVACCLYTVLVFGGSIFTRINGNYADRKVDPIVEDNFAALQKKESKGPVVEPNKPFAACLFAFYDHAVKGPDKVAQMNKALLVKLKTILTEKVPTMALMISYGMIMEYPPSHDGAEGDFHEGGHLKDEHNKTWMPMTKYPELTFPGPFRSMVYKRIMPEGEREQMAAEEDGEEKLAEFEAAWEADTRIPLSAELFDGELTSIDPESPPEGFPADLVNTWPPTFYASVGFDAIDLVINQDISSPQDEMTNHMFYTDWKNHKEASNTELLIAFGTLDARFIIAHFFQFPCLHKDFKKFYHGTGGVDNADDAFIVEGSFHVLAEITFEGSQYIHRHRNLYKDEQADNEADAINVGCCGGSKDHPEENPQEAGDPTTAGSESGKGAGAGGEDVEMEEVGVVIEPKKDEGWDAWGTKGKCMLWRDGEEEKLPEGVLKPAFFDCVVAGSSCHVFKHYSFKPVVASAEELKFVFGCAEGEEEKDIKSRDCAAKTHAQCARDILRHGVYNTCTHKAWGLHEKVKERRWEVCYEHSRLNNDYKYLVEQNSNARTIKCVYTPDSSLTATHSAMAQKVLGLFLSLILLAMTAVGVICVTRYEAELNEYSNYASTIILTFIKSVIPMLVKYCVKIEDWENPDTVMRMTLIRVYFLKMATLFVLVYNIDSSTNKETICLEAVTAMNFYKLIIINGISMCISNFCTYFGMFWAAGGWDGNKDAKTQYDHEYVSQAYIDLNYNQGLFLIGVLYAPMLPIVWVIFNALEFWVLVLCLKNWCRLAEKPYESKDANYTLWFLVATWVICCIPMATFLTTPPSKNCGDGLNDITCMCGPFEESIQMKYTALSTMVSTDVPAAGNIAEYALNPMIVYGAILCLAVWIIWLRTQLDQVRNQCVDTYLTNYHLVRDKQRMIAKRQLEEKGYKKQLDSLEAELNILKPKTD